MIDQDLLEQLQYVMLEPPDGGASWHSDLWTRDEVIDYVNERQDRFVKGTHLRVESTTIAVVAGQFEYTLPADWVATLRVYWEPTSGTKKALVKSSGWEADHGLGTWTTQATPKLYTDVDTIPLRIRLMPVPNANGTIEVLYVANCAAISGDGVEMTLTNDFLPTIKYGALADMFSKVGRAHDPTRAAYCEQRYQLGIDITNTLLKGFKR